MKARSYRQRHPRHPMQPPRIDDWEDYLAFLARERRRVDLGKLTQMEFLALRPNQRDRHKEPEREYGRRRRDNEKRAGVRAAHRHARVAAIKATRDPDAEAFYREVREASEVSCSYCGTLIDGALAEVDHVIPISRGGRHQRANLTAACHQCNRSKRALTGEEFRARMFSESSNGRRRQEVDRTPNPRKRAYGGRS